MIYTRVILVLLIILILVYYAMIVAHLSGVINLTERKRRQWQLLRHSKSLK